MRENQCWIRGDVVERTRNGRPTVTVSRSTNHATGLPEVGGFQPGSRWIGSTASGETNSTP